MTLPCYEYTYNVVALFVAIIDIAVTKFYLGEDLDHYISRVPRSTFLAYLLDLEVFTLRLTNLDTYMKKLAERITIQPKMQLNDQCSIIKNGTEYEKTLKNKLENNLNINHYTLTEGNGTMGRTCMADSTITGNDYEKPLPEKGPS